MDKSRDVRRGASRFSRQQQSGQKQLLAGLELDGGVGEDFVSLEKPKKKGRFTKKLSVNKASSSYEDCEMECNNTNISDRENELPSQSHSSMSNATTKRFKLPKKFFDDCNGVDHSSVPRKLRSAMKKRNRESVSPPLPDSKKLSHTISGVESLKKDGMKKSKLNMKQGRSDWSQKQVVGPITKDEEEVVETLYALAVMFPDNDSANKSKLESDPSDAKPTGLPEHRESPSPAIEVAKEDLSSDCPLRISEFSPSSNVESSLKETVIFNSLKKPTVEENPNLHDSKDFHMKTESFISSVNVDSMMPSLAKREHNNDEASCNPGNFQVLPELCLVFGLERSTRKETSFLRRKPEIALAASTSGSQLGQQDMITESRKNGLALWPGLSPTVLHGAGCPGPSLQSSAAKIPAWLDAAVGASKPCVLENGPLTGKVPKVVTDSTSLRRCTTHVYIGRLIRNLQMSEYKEKLSPQPNELKPPQEGLRQGIRMANNDFDRVKNGLNGVTSGSNITTERNSIEARSGVVQQQRPHQDQQQAAMASRMHTLPKESFSFLSLSAGGGGADTTNSFSRIRNNGLETSSHFQVSYLHSLAQHQKFMPHAMPQNCCTSAYPDQLSTSASTQQVQLQFPPYLSSPFLAPTHTSSIVLAKQQQQQLWAAQLTAQCRPAGTSTAMSQFPNWPNGRQNPTLIPCPQSLVSPSHPSLEVLGPKYAPISQQQQQQQQQQLMAISSLPYARVRRQDHRLPSVYEEIEGGFRTGGSSLPLQLLCNEGL